MNHKAFPALAAVLFASLPVLSDGSNETNPEITALLGNAKSAASAVAGDIETLDLLAGQAQTQATVLHLYKNDIATLRSQAEKLAALRKQGSEAQQTAVERIVPIMQEFASAADAAVEIASAQKTSAGSPGTEYYKLNSDLSGEFAALISNWANYARTKDDLDRAAAKLRSPALR
jgi:hypothetical protein